ncbi:MAG: polysaccharide biosynthesis protein [Candidatus Binatia bacterium]|nr:MAG: polysaccharide biosynthesis protein [Candidatus Binatia bacterium]
MNYAVFDIETRIDKELVRRVFFADRELDAEAAYERMRAELERQGRDMFPHSVHVPVSIAVGNVDERHVLRSVETLGGPQADEKAMVREFWSRLDRFRGTLVSFNGRRFDLPVLELAALRYGCVAPTYFNEPSRFRGRGAEGHYDLYDFLTNQGACGIRGGLDLLAKLVGLPGKEEVGGRLVQELWERGEIEAIHRYCRRDVIQTYALFLHVERMRGRISDEEFETARRESALFFRELESSETVRNTP